MQVSKYRAGCTILDRHSGQIQVGIGPVCCGHAGVLGCGHADRHLCLLSGDLVALVVQGVLHIMERCLRAPAEYHTNTVPKPHWMLHVQGAQHIDVPCLDGHNSTMM